MRLRDFRPKAADTAGLLQTIDNIIEDNHIVKGRFVGMILPLAIKSIAKAIINN